MSFTSFIANGRTRLVAALVVGLVLAPASFADDDPTYYKPFDFEFGGRLMLDFTAASADEELGPVDDGVEWRRARVYWSGVMYKRVKFKAQFGFAQGDLEFKDVYMELTKVPVIGKIRVGHFLEPYSLETLTSSRYITFVERGVPDAFSAGRNTGIGIGNTALDKRIQWEFGAFWFTNAFGDNEAGSGDFNVTGRITGLPVFEDRGKKLFHLGFATQIQDRDDSTLRYRIRPEAHLSPRYLNTGTLDADSATQFNFETAMVYNNFSAQAQYEIIEPDMTSQSDPSFSTYYVFVSWFPTGEYRRYSQKKGAFARVRPNRNFLDGTGDGFGAVELAARYSSVDLNDAGVFGGKMDSVTLGVNWYLNPRTRVMLNYVDADVENSGSSQWAVLRFQVDF